MGAAADAAGHGPALSVHRLRDRVGHLTVACVADGLGVSWNTANDAVPAEGRRVLIDDPGRLDGVAVVGVDEHVWRHTRCRS
jgi:hypothetical protein